MTNRAVAVIGALMFLFVMTGGFASQYDNSARGEPIAGSSENETFAVTEDTVIQLNESGRTDIVFNRDVTVRQANAPVPQDGNYQWIESNGTLRIYEDTEFDTSKDAEITYKWHRPSAEQNKIRDIALLVYDLGGGLGLLGGAALLIGSVVLLGRQR